MLHDVTVNSGISMIGDIRWGTHFCKFYETEEDLWSVVIPYFQAGLVNNEFCIWVASSEEQKLVLMKIMEERIADFREFVQKGQMQFYNRAEMSCPCAEDAASVEDPFIALEKEKLAAGYRGIRLAGTAVQEAFGEGWDNFIKYEMKVNRAFHDRRIIALCCYALKECEAHAILDIIKSHQFALVLRNNKWELIESSAIKILKNELQKANDELENRVAERTQKLEQALKARDQFFSVVSHELRTPLTCMRLYVDAMLFSDDFSRPVEVKNVFKKIQEQSLCLENLINSLLEAAFRPRDSGLIFEIKPERMDLGELVQRVVKGIAKDRNASDCSVKIESDTPIVGYWDMFRLTQAINHLINNTIKKPSSPKLIISVTQEEKMAKLVFREDEPGILAKERPYIFDHFRQDAGESAESRLGMGLWLVKKIVEAHQGTIDLQEDTGRGSCFEVRLPLMSEGIAALSDLEF